MEPGLLISFEGVDGCGKSTQLRRLADALLAVGVEPLVVREPGGTPLGEQVREILLSPATGEIDHAAEALLYAASRAELVATVIEPALAAGRIVLVDRYVDSSLAYQGAGRGLGLERVLEANLLATRGRLPHVTVLVQLDPAAARARARSAGAEADRLEQAGGAFFSRVAAAYRELAERWPERIVTVDGDGSPAEVEQRVRQAVEPQLRARGVELPAPSAPVATEALP